MTRTITSATLTEKTKTDGAEPVYILEVQYGGATGTKYYAAEDLTSPVTAEGRVLSWGNITVSGEIGKIGGFDSTTIQLGDADHVLDALWKVSPGVQNKKAYLHLYFGGTTWADDKVTVAGGVLAAPKWSSVNSSWEVTLKSFDHLFDKSVGTPLTRQAFPEVICSDCDGDIIPIAYGSPVKRVPACLIDRPGYGYLAWPLGPNDTYMYLHDTATNLGFPVDSTIHIDVGSEYITGCFCNSGDRTQFTIYSRQIFDGVGQVAGFLGSGGLQYVLIPRASFADFDHLDQTTPASRFGAAIEFFYDGLWHIYSVSMWIITGSNVAVLPQGSANIQVGTPWRVSSTGSTFVNWPAGTQVGQRGIWTYVCNHLPSESVERVEVRAPYRFANGAQVETWYEYAPSAYAASLNNKSFNAQLGRGAADQGVTTVRLGLSPIALGLSSNKIWVTLKGIRGSTYAYTDPVSIIEHMITHNHMGGISSSFVDATSFADAYAGVSTTAMAFVITDRKKLSELVDDIAHQGFCQAWWDNGKIHLAAIDNTLDSGDVVWTATDTNIKEESLEISEVDVNEWTTEMTSNYQPTAGPDPDQHIVRTSNAAAAQYGKHEDDLDLWCFQSVSQVAAATEHWLTYNLARQRTVRLESYLNAIHVQPGDVVKVSHLDGDGNHVLNNQLVRVTRTELKPGAEGEIDTVSIEGEYTLWSWTIEAATFTDIECFQPVNDQPQGNPSASSGNTYITPFSSGLGSSGELPTGSGPSSRFTNNSDGGTGTIFWPWSSESPASSGATRSYPTSGGPTETPTTSGGGSSSGGGGSSSGSSSSGGGSSSSVSPTCVSKGSTSAYNYDDGGDVAWDTSSPTHCGNMDEGLVNGETSQMMVVLSFGTFSIPLDATLNSVTVTVDRRDIDEGATNMRVDLATGGSASGGGSSIANATVGGAWPGSWTDADADMGTGMSIADLNDADLEVWISEVNGTATDGIPRVASVTIEVCYTPA